MKSTTIVNLGCSTFCGTSILVEVVTKHDKPSPIIMSKAIETTATALGWRTVEQGDPNRWLCWGCK